MVFFPSKFKYFLAYSRGLQRGVVIALCLNCNETVCEQDVCEFHSEHTCQPDLDSIEPLFDRAPITIADSIDALVGPEGVAQCRRMDTLEAVDLREASADNVSVSSPTHPHLRTVIL